MAKQKEVIPAENAEGQVVPVSTATGAVLENVESPNDDKAPEDTPVKLDKHIDDILQAHPHYEELYIDKLGGVFTSDTNQKLLGKAILYKNPHFNN